jgi:hypothetical protein
MANKQTTKATAVAPSTATAAAPSTATVVAASVALPTGSATKNGAVATVPTTKGNSYSLPCASNSPCVVRNGYVAGYTAHFVALHSAPTSAARSGPCWPALYSGSSGSASPKPGGQPAAQYSTHAVLVPNGGGAAKWGMVHVYGGKAQNTAGSTANGSMVAAAAPPGAQCGGVPCKATLALAAANGLVAPC